LNSNPRAIIKAKKHNPPILTRLACQNFRAWPHLRILVILADNHVYFKENCINKFAIEDLANECRVQRLQITNSLKYLRKHNYIIKIGPYEYINPLYCYQCGPEVLKQLREDIVDERKLYLEGKLYKKPSYWPSKKFDFRSIKPATMEDEPK
jgi:hypothetical protein